MSQDIEHDSGQRRSSVETERHRSNISLRIGIVLVLCVFAIALTMALFLRESPDSELSGDATESLHVAASQNDVLALTALLDQGIPINDLDEHGWSALHKAAGLGCTAATKFLLDNGANVNVRQTIHQEAWQSRPMSGPTPLHLAIRKGSLDTAKLLLEAGADPDLTCWDGKASTLTLAVKTGSLSAIDLLLEHGAMLDPPMLEDLDPMQKLIAQKSLMARAPDPLTRAIETGRLEVAKYLHSKGARIRPAFLLMAVEYGYADIAAWILDQGVDVNYSQSRSAFFRRPTMEKGRSGIFIHSENCTALEIAFTYDDIPIMGMLLRRGAVSGDLLHQAAGKGNAAVVRLLLEHGENATARNSDGLTALQIAADKGQRECVKILKAAMR